MNRRILVVEDSGLVAVDLEEQLVEDGYRVVGPASDLARWTFENATR